MRQVFLFCAIALLFTACGNPAEEGEESVALKDLPPAVQESVRNIVQGAELKGFSKEMENGKTIYEIETVKNGKTRDILIDNAGVILEVEESTTLDRIPGPAKSAIEKAAEGGKIAKVESVTGNRANDYEAVIVKGDTNSEIKVTAEGAIIE